MGSGPVARTESGAGEPMKVSVQCSHCLTAASLFEVNVAAWAAEHHATRHPDEAMSYTVVRRAGDQWPMGVIEAERIREARAGAVATARASVSVGSAANAAPLHPVCGLLYDVDRCALPLGHAGECRDHEGYPIELPF